MKHPNFFNKVYYVSCTGHYLSFELFYGDLARRCRAVSASIFCNADLCKMKKEKFIGG
jgi:hypothetical protein